MVKNVRTYLLLFGRIWVPFTAGLVLGLAVALMMSPQEDNTFGVIAVVLFNIFWLYKVAIPNYRVIREVYRKLLAHAEEEGTTGLYPTWLKKDPTFPPLDPELLSFFFERLVTSELLTKESDSGYVITEAGKRWLASCRVLSP